MEAEIAQTRSGLADTVDQLTAKPDVKARTRGRFDQTSDQLAEQVVGRVHAVRDGVTDRGRLTPTAVRTGGAVSFVVVAVVALMVWRRDH
jgi:hypothetical protein